MPQAQYAEGAFNYSGITIPEVFPTKLLHKFYAKCVATAITNTDFQGDVSKYGDVFKLRKNGNVNVKDYLKSGRIATEQIPFTVTDLNIDKQKYFAVEINDVNRFQSNINEQEAHAADASKQMAIAVDTDLLQSVYDDMSAYNYGATAGITTGNFNLGASGSPVKIDKSNIIHNLLKGNSVLAQQNVDTQGEQGKLWCVAPPEFCNMLRESDIGDISVSGDSMTLMRAGQIAAKPFGGFTVYESNLLKTASDGGHTCYHILMGHKKAITFGSQIDKTEVVRPWDGFETVLKGLMVYGYVVQNPEALVDLYCYIDVN